MGLFSAADFDRLAEQLRRIQGRFLMSLNDAPEVRRIFTGFRIDPVKVNYSVNGRQQGDAAELLIRSEVHDEGLFSASLEEG